MDKYLRCLSLLFFAVFTFSSAFADEAGSSFCRHELRIGYGDALIQSVKQPLDCASPDASSGLSLEGVPVAKADAILRSQRYSVGTDYYTGHFFVDYLYRITPVVSVGLGADFMKRGSSVKMYDGYGTYKRTYDNDLYIVSVTPTVRFSYLERRHVHLYSAVGIGYSCVVGDWYLKDIQLHGGGVNITLVGIQVGGKHVFGAFDLGSYNALYYVDRDYYTYSGSVALLPFSRIMNISVGCKF